jgi:benzoylformate decarboxylase
MKHLAGKDALLEQLVSDGTQYIFGNPGTTEQAFMDALQDHPEVTYILCLHEGVAVSMADAYARATRRPTFVQLHIAPGLGNAMGMLYNAFTSHTPMVVYVGQSASDIRLQEPLLGADLVAMAGPVTKWAYEPNNAAEIPQTLRRAVKTADEHPQGPVLVSLPIDIMEDRVDVEICPTSLTRWRVHPDPEAIDEAAALLADSKQPLVIIGDGISLSNAQAGVQHLAEQIGAPIYQAYSTEVNVAFDHPLYAGSLPYTSAQAAEIIAGVLEAHDVVIAIGTPVFRLIFPQPQLSVPSGRPFIHIDLDERELGKNTVGALQIKADCGAAIESLLQRLDERRPVDADRRASTIAERIGATRDAWLARDRERWNQTPISIPRLMGEIADALPADASIFDEAMTSSSALQRYIAPLPGQYFRARGGGIGPGIPGAIGLQLARGKQPVVGVVSDGASMYAITALWTAAHHDVPVVIVVCNNGAYRILKNNLVDYLGPAAVARHFVELDLSPPELRFDEIARSMGVHGRRVEHPADIAPALAEAFALRRPALIDVVVEGAARVE